MLVPGGGAGVMGAIRDAEAAGTGSLLLPATGVADAVGPASPHEARIMDRPNSAAVRIAQWYCRAPLRLRRGGGTGRRVGLKNRCPQGRAGSTPALGTRYLLW